MMDHHYLDHFWSYLFTLHHNPYLILTCITFITHEIVYYGRYLPYIIADLFPSLFLRYKLQPDKPLSPQQYWKCLKGVLFAHYCIELPLMLFVYPTAVALGIIITHVPLPSWSQIIFESTLFLIIEDTYHYWAHRALHYGDLYKLIHKQHHEFAAPVGLCAEYAHPLEILILSIGTFLGPFIYSCFTDQFHFFSLLFWSIIRTCQAVEAHSGYDFPWSINKFIPFWSGADHHDFHHQFFLGNYSTSFRWWDFFMNTEGSYRLVRAKQALAKAQCEHDHSSSIKPKQR